MDTVATLQEDKWLNWQPWIPLYNSWRASAGVPQVPGLYRIRRVGSREIDYIGQTGTGAMKLRARLSMLRGVYGNEMPYRAPHTAGPALWALRRISKIGGSAVYHTNSMSPTDTITRPTSDRGVPEANGNLPPVNEDDKYDDYEVSVAALPHLDTWHRLGQECLAIALYRQEQGTSPTVNFGRMPAGFRMSSDNNAKLVTAGKRFRGGPFDMNVDLPPFSDASHLPSLAPVGPLTVDDVHALEWGGHAWSPWLPMETALTTVPADGVGLYRIRPAPSGSSANDSSVSMPLAYIGQGRIRSRLTSHRFKGWMNDMGGSEVSWVVNNYWHPHQRLELENDLIAAYILRTMAESTTEGMATGTPPTAQFGEAR